jgi:hypothetical protein
MNNKNALTHFIGYQAFLKKYKTMTFIKKKFKQMYIDNFLFLLHCQFSM